MIKIIIVAYDMNPNWGSESGVAAEWTKIISNLYQTEVYTDHANKHDLDAAPIANAKINYVTGTGIFRALERRTGLRGIAARAFNVTVFRQLSKEDLTGISLIHCLTPAGIHTYNQLYKLGVPILIGPIGGGLPTPNGFERAFRFQLLRMTVRDKVYKFLLKRRGWLEYVRNAKCVIVGTDYLKEVLPVDVRKRCAVIFDAVVDVNTFRPKAANNKSRPNVKLLFVGRLESNKGVTILVEAIRKCVIKGVDHIVVDIVGDGALRSVLTDMIYRYGLGRYVFLSGQLPRADVIHKMQSADIFVLPTLREPGGTAILEAMACGLPVITSNYGGPRDIVTDLCGVKIDLRGYDAYVEDLADAIALLASDPQRRDLLGRNGRARVEAEFSVDALRVKIKHLYDSILKQV